MAERFYTLKVREVRRETPECVSVAFDVPAVLADTFVFSAGQYLTLRTVLDDEEVRRSYSICSSPEEEELRVAIKRVQSGKFSTFANDSLKVNDELEVMAPNGKFCVKHEADRAKHYLMIAAGSGITPIISLVKSILAKAPASKVTLFYGNKSRASIIFKKELAALKNRYVERLGIFHIFSREQLESPLMEGRVDGDKLKRLLQLVVLPSQLNEVFICGPEEMMLAQRETLLSLGVPKEKIHVELFGTSKAIVRARQRRQARSEGQAAACTVHITVDGASFSFDLQAGAESVLDGALRHGADLPFACKGGVCTTCKARLEAGEVEMDVNYGLEPEEVAAGLILTCQAHPTTSTIRVNYDAR